MGIFHGIPGEAEDAVATIIDKDIRLRPTEVGNTCVKDYVDSGNNTRVQKINDELSVDQIERLGDRILT